MRCIGIDLSLTSTGLAVIDSESNTVMVHGSFGTDVETPIIKRIHAIVTWIKQHLLESQCHVAAIEVEAYSQSSSQAMVQLSELAGACKEELYSRGMEVYTYPSSTWKSYVAGSGKLANKYDNTTLYFAQVSNALIARGLKIERMSTTDELDACSMAALAIEEWDLRQNPRAYFTDAIIRQYASLITMRMLESKFLRKAQRNSKNHKKGEIYHPDLKMFPTFKYKTITKLEPGYLNQVIDQFIYK